MNILILQRRSRTANNIFSLSVEVRILEIIDFLKKNGYVQYAIAYADDTHIGNIIKWADVIIISRNLSEHEINVIRKAKEIDRYIILDIDDYFFSKPSYSQQSEFSQDNIWKLQKIARSIDHIIVSNKLIRDVLAEHGILSTIIRTRVNIQKARPRKKTGGSLKYVYTTTDNIKLSAFKKNFIQMLQDFHAEFSDMKMVVYSDTIYDIIRLPFVEWFPRMHYKEYKESLSREDYLFSITPLGGDEDKEDALFHDCKSPVKYFDYGLAHIPGVYSDVHLYRSCITHGKTGFLVKNDCNKWYRSMKLFYTDKNLRDTIAWNAYADICENHNIEKSAYEYYDILKSVVQSDCGGRCLDSINTEGRRDYKQRNV